MSQSVFGEVAREVGSLANPIAERASKPVHGRSGGPQGSASVVLISPARVWPGFLLTHHGGRVGRLRHYPIALELARLQRKAEAGQAPPPLIPPANAVKEVRK